MLVVDLRDEPQIPPALALLKRKHPSTGVLLVASQLDPTLMLEAMRAGVNEFVTASGDGRRTAGRDQAVMGNLGTGARGEVFAFIGAKGGVGATTVAVNIATALAKAEPGLDAADRPERGLRRCRGVPWRGAALLRDGCARERAAARLRRFSADWLFAASPVSICSAPPGGQ